jgi:hypothetical protein
MHTSSLVVRDQQTGALVAEWYLQDGGWQYGGDGRSGAGTGSSTQLGDPLSQADVLALPQPPEKASLLFVIGPRQQQDVGGAAAPLAGAAAEAGEVVLDPAAVRRLQCKVSGLPSRCAVCAGGTRCICAGIFFWPRASSDSFSGSGGRSLITIEKRKLHHDHRGAWPPSQTQVEDRRAPCSAWQRIRLQS